MSDPDARPLIASIVCVRRFRGGSRIEKLGVEVAGEVRHYHPAGVLFAVKLGAWRLFLATGAEAPRELEVAVDAYDREFLRVVGTSALEDDALPAAAGCSHSAVSDAFDAVG